MAYAIAVLLPRDALTVSHPAHCHPRTLHAGRVPAVPRGSSPGLRNVSADAASSSGGNVDSPTPRPLPDLSRVRGVLFDIDGTLTDSDPLHFLA
jgi:hypothetical protein